MEPITIGAIGRASVTVDQTNLAQTVGSGSLPVFATPMLAALMEQAACAAVAPYLTQGETTVGTALELRHDAATPLGLTVCATAQVTAVCGREISFHVMAEDGAGEIGAGLHKRFLVDGAQFLEKTFRRGKNTEQG